MRQLREAQGLSVDGLARVTNCDRSLIAAIESNRLPIPGRHLIAYANALKIGVEELALLWVNQELRKMFAEAGIALLFKVVPADWGEIPHIPPAPGERTPPFNYQR